MNVENLTLKSIYTILLISLFAIGSKATYGQLLVPFENTTFASNAYGWESCILPDFPDENTFVEQPGRFNVHTLPKHGSSYIHIITRQNGSYSNIGQRLSRFLKKDSLYNFTVFLAKSKTLESRVLEDKIVYSYNKSIKVKIWGSSRSCEKQELLFETGIIDHADWREYEVRFTPKRDLEYIYFDPSPPEEDKFVRGNVLIDAINYKQTLLNDSLKIANLATYELLNAITNDKKICSINTPLCCVIKQIENLKSNEQDLFNFLKGLEDQSFDSVLTFFNDVDAKEISLLFEKAKSIKKNPSSAEDQAFISSFNSTYLELKKMPLDKYLNQYALKHKSSIVNEIFSAKYK